MADAFDLRLKVQALVQSADNGASFESAWDALQRQAQDDDLFDSQASLLAELLLIGDDDGGTVLDALDESRTTQGAWHMICVGGG